MEENQNNTDDAQPPVDRPINSPNVSESTEQAKQKRTKKEIILFSSTVGIITAGILAGAIVFFQNHALPYTYLGGEPIGYWSRDRVSKFIEDKTASMSVKIKTKETTQDTSSSELGYSFDRAKTTERIFERQKSIFGRLSFWHPKNNSYHYSLDGEKLSDFVAKQEVESVKSENAKITYTDGELGVIPEVSSIKLTIPDIEQRLEEALMSARSVTFALQDVQTQPKITKNDIELMLPEIKKYTDTALTIQIDSRKFYPKPENVASWVSFEKNDNKVGIVVDEVAIASYLNSLVETFSDAPSPRIVILDDQGAEKEIFAGKEGMGIGENNFAIKEIVNSLKIHEAKNISVELEKVNPRTISAATYPKWIHVDLTNKQLYAYEYGKLVKQIPVSAGAPATPTVLGEYKIRTKVRSQTMRGLNVDGSTYSQPNVEWISYFYGSYAIHGNYWRPTSWFGATNSSHGCVGMQNHNAKWVYEWAPVGTPVINHY